MREGGVRLIVGFLTFTVNDICFLIYKWLSMSDVACC